MRIALFQIFVNLFKIYLFILERGKNTHSFVEPVIYALIGCFLYVSWLEIEPQTLTYLDDTVTNELHSQGPPIFVM